MPFFWGGGGHFVKHYQDVKIKYKTNKGNARKQKQNKQKYGGGE